MRVPSPCLIVLVGPSGAGKSAWAAANFRPDQVVASDALRALVGSGQGDQRAGTDAFAVLDLVVERRLARGLLTVIDTLGLDADRRGI
jgi:predicted kinase